MLSTIIGMVPAVASSLPESLLPLHRRHDAIPASLSATQPIAVLQFDLAAQVAQALLSMSQCQSILAHVCHLWVLLQGLIWQVHLGLLSRLSKLAVVPLQLHLLTNSSSAVEEVDG